MDNFLQSFLKIEKKTLKNSAISAFLRVFIIWCPTYKMAMFLLLVGFVYVLKTETKVSAFLDTKELSKEIGYSHGKEANDQVAKHGWLGWCFS